MTPCSSAIKSKKFKGSTLSLLYTNRGVEYVVKEDIDRGIADHDQAIKLDPKNSLAFNNRGNAYGAKREFDRAIADYDQAIKLNPKYAAAFYNRGIAKQTKGDLEGSEADVARLDNSSRASGSNSRRRLVATVAGYRP